MDYLKKIVCNFTFIKYVDSKGVETIEFRKNWTGDKLTMIMNDFDKLSQPTNDEVVEDTKAE